MPIAHPLPTWLSDLTETLLDELPRIEYLCDRLGVEDAHQLRVFLELTGNALRSTDRLVLELERTTYGAQFDALLEVADGSRGTSLR